MFNISVGRLEVVNAYSSIAQSTNELEVSLRKLGDTSYDRFVCVRAACVCAG